MKNISFHFHHGATVAVEDNGKYVILEMERYYRNRYGGIMCRDDKEFTKRITQMLCILEDKYGIDRTYDKCSFIASSRFNSHRHSEFIDIIANLIECDNMIITDHHHSHAAGAFYQSPYNDALIISFDGSGNDGKFNIYRGSNKTLSLVKKLDINSIGKAYRKVSLTLKDISKINHNNRIKKMISFSGKLMGLSAYGNIHHEWMDDFRKIYSRDTEGDISTINGINFIGSNIFKHYATSNSNMEFYKEFEGQFAYDIARTNQHYFEEYFLDLVEYTIKEYNLPIILTGGCALNVLLNERLRVKFNNNIFIPPNPDDSGLAFGGLTLLNPPDEKVDITYCGMPILDIDSELNNVLTNYPNEKMSIPNVAKLLKEGNIIGVMRGNAEVGPRALGNRSIICDPKFPNMKDKLNKIKNREWFRPFAPAVRYEDRNKYFEFEHESRFMSFGPLVRKEYRKLFPSITHVDGTARVQTVRREQHEFFYDIMTEMDSIILNTSFNINGEPMVTRVREAIYALDNTSLDYIIIDDYLIKKRD